jgi:hypothetical protein
MSEEDKVRRLAELKAYIEKREHELEQELSRLRSLEEIVDTSLAEKSFRRVEVPKTEPAPGQSKTVPSSPVAESIPCPTMSIKTVSGIDLADMQIDQDEVRVIPRPDMRFDPNAPPLRAFLIGRVLDPMRSKDLSSLQTGQMTEDRTLSYRVDQDGDVLKQIVVRNYGDEKRLQELRSAISWTMRRLYERKAVK